MIAGVRGHYFHFCIQLPLKPRAPRCFGMWPASSFTPSPEASKELKLFCGSQLPIHICPAEYKHAKGFWNIILKSNCLIITHIVECNYPFICWLLLSKVIHSSVSPFVPVCISSAYLAVSPSSCISSNSWLICALILANFGMYLLQDFKRKTVSN